MNVNFGERIKNAQQIIKKHCGKLILIFIVVLGVLFIFYLRNMKAMLLKNAESGDVEISIVKISSDEQERYDITLSDEQKSKMLELFSNTYLRVKVFEEEYISEDYMGYYIMSSNNEDIFYYFSTDIISIDGRQYVIYGNNTANEFEMILEGANAN